MPNFDEIIQTTSPGEQDALMIQALKRQEYNRRYQAKLRQVAKLATLERKIDNNLNYVLGYIKRKYAVEYANYVEPTPEQPKPVIDAGFSNWLILSANEYKSANEAFELSGLSDHMTIKEFTRLFSQYYNENNSGRYIKY